MSSKTVYLLVLLVFGADGKYVKHRSPRFIGGTYTSFVTSTQLVTSIVPSSCVSVDPTLQPCRSVRYLGFPNFATWGITINFNNATVAKSIKSESTLQGWGEYFGIYAPTVTVTQLEIQTTVVKDPMIVVTYAVKGCRPHKIPEDLDRCEIPATLSLQEIIPTSTVSVIQSSSTINSGLKSLSNVNLIHDNALKNGTTQNQSTIESSTENFVKENLYSKVPTEPLPF